MYQGRLRAFAHDHADRNELNANKGGIMNDRLATDKEIMNYVTEKDDDGDETLYMNAIIHNNNVGLDWVHEEEDAESCAQRFLVRVRTLVGASHSFPPKSAALTMRLYRRGDVLVSSMACADEYQDEAIRLAQDAALALYDEVYPDVALAAIRFVEESVENVKRFAALDTDPILRSKSGKTLAADQFLPQLLEQAKADLVKTGEVVQRIGWRVQNGLALFPIYVPHEKYRYFRAVATVAQKVNADAVVYVSDGYVLSPGGERTGQEILQVMWVNPDASGVNAGLAYTRRKHPLLSREIIDFLPDMFPPDSKLNQKIIPAWGSYQPS
jgi:hypothetical protein